MSDELVNTLKLIRQGVRNVRTRMATPDGDLNHILTALDRLIIDRDDAPKWRAKIGSNATVEQELDYWRSYDSEFGKRLNEPVKAAEPEEKKTDPAAEIDRDALIDFIVKAVPGEGKVKIENVKLASVGFSKRTLLIGLSGNKVLPKDIVLRVDQPVSFFGTTVVQEFPAVRLLADLKVPVPYPYALEDTGKVLGTPFILFARAYGDTIGSNYFPPPKNDKLAAHVAETLVKIHAVPIDGVKDLLTRQPAGKTYIEDEVERFEKSWRDMKLDIPLIETGFKWMREHLDDAQGALGIVHNDYNYHNFLCQGDKLEAVLDWEFVHIGNPVSDLGYHSANAYPTGGFEPFLEAYVKAGGKRPRPEELKFYTLWGHLRMGMLSIQADRGVAAGNGTDIRHTLSWPIWTPKTMIGFAETLLGKH